MRKKQEPRAGTGADIEKLNWFQTRIQLVFYAEQKSEIEQLEAMLETTQSELATEFIEQSCWRDNPAIKPFLGGKGTPEERLTALRTALAEQRNA